MGSTQRQRGIQPAEQNRVTGVGEGWVWCPGKERGRGRCVTSEEVRLGRLASELADLHWPHASRGAALSGRGGPLRGRGRCWVFNVPARLEARFRGGLGRRLTSYGVDLGGPRWEVRCSDFRCGKSFQFSSTAHATARSPLLGAWAPPGTGPRRQLRTPARALHGGTCVRAGTSTYAPHRPWHGGSTTRLPPEPGRRTP